MKLLRALPLKTKLPMIIVGLCLTVGAVLQTVNTLDFRAAALEAEAELFEANSNAKAKELALWYDKRASMLRTLALSPDMQRRTEEMEAGFNAIANAPEVLRRAYVDQNPNPAGEKQDFDRAPGIEAYHDVHAWVNPWFRQMAELNNFYDMFIIDDDANVIYSEFKEADYMANLVSGALSDSGLAKVFNQARQAKPGEVFMSDLERYAPSGGIPAIFMATPLTNDAGTVVGVLAVQLDYSKLETITNDPKGMGETGQAIIVGQDGKTRTPSRKEGVFEDLHQMTLDAPQIRAAMAGEAAYFEDATNMAGQEVLAKVLPLPELGVNWSLVLEIDRAEVMAPTDAAMWAMLMIGAAMAAMALGAGIFFARTITKPVDRLSKAIDQIANGGLQVTVVDADRGDELGVIANSLNGLLDKLTVAKMAEEERERLQVELRAVVDSLSSGLQDLSEGNLTRPITADFPADYDSLRLDFNATRQNLATTIAQVIEASHSIRGRSTELSTASEDLSRRTENQAAALEETAAALDELTASVKSAAEGAREVEKIVRTARKEAEDSGLVVQSAIAAMAEIEKSSEQISQIIGAIDDIAFQTNLLALNAGVEAARAGDAGRGFAVVASEVRALAQRSSVAAKEIKTLIAASAQHVGSGVDQVGRAGAALTSIVGSVANISTLVSGIAAAAAEQSTGLAEVNIGVTQLDQVTQKNAAMVEESTAASHTLHQDAAGLAKLVSKFMIPQGQAAAENDGAGEIDKGRVVTLSQFVPTDFAGPETQPVLPLSPAVARPAKSSSVAAKAMWQDF